MTNHELRYRCFMDGARDPMRVAASVSLAVSRGDRLGELLTELRRQQPALFGPPRKQ